MQNVFLKIDRRILIAIGIVLIVALIAGFLVYRYSRDIGETAQNNGSEIIIETPGEQIITPSENAQTEPQPDLPVQPGLTVCADKCGDGICQPAGTICQDSLNCVCAETRADCPSDCNN